MTIGIGYFIGGLVLVLYSIMCFWIGIKKPESMIRLVKAKLFMKDKPDSTAALFCNIWGGIALAAGIIVFVLGYVNAA